MKTKNGNNGANAASDTAKLLEQLKVMHLKYVAQNFELQAQKAALAQSPHVDYLAQLIDGET